MCYPKEIINTLFRMLGQNHRSSLSILHGWMEYFWLYSGDRQHRWHRYGRLDGGLSCFPDTSASSTGLSYWSHLKAHQSCQRHSEVTLCSDRLTTGVVQYWSLVRYELMYNDHNASQIVMTSNKLPEKTLIFYCIFLIKSHILNKVY